MKKFISCFMILSAVALSHTAAGCDAFMCVTAPPWSGTGMGSNTDATGSSSSTMEQALTRAMQIRANYECNAQADAAGKECKEAYDRLNMVCKSFNTTLLSYPAAAASKFLASIEIQMSTRTIGVLRSGGAIAGFATDTIVPCGTLTEKAMGYCDAGMQKMKNGCPAKPL